MEILVKSHEDMIDFGKKIGLQLVKPMTILLNGDLGAGKTTLTKGIAEGLEVTDIITSPTFTIAKMYEGRMDLNHIDAYRLEGLSEDIGLDEYMTENSITVIEWSDFLPDDFVDYLEIKIDYKNDGRMLKINAFGNNSSEVMEAIEHDIRD